MFGVSPFIMTLGMSSVGFGIALFLTGGVPVYGMPDEFGEFFGFGLIFGIPVPIYAAAILVILTWLFVNRTRQGRYFYAVGGNVKAAQLSGINTRFTLFITYVLCALLAGIAGMLLTARLDTGEANIGASMPLESIAACVIAGVSLRGGVGRVGERRARRAVHRAGPERHEPRADRIVPADRGARRAAHPRGHRRPVAAPLHRRGAGLNEHARRFENAGPPLPSFRRKPESITAGSICFVLAPGGEVSDGPRLEFTPDRDRGPG